jgi:peptidoglycan/LPS O-acetylase OafA/YrhL
LIEEMVNRRPPPEPPNATSDPLVQGERTPSIPYRHDIDGLRAIAVVLVILYHAGVPPFSGGYIGVDVFFVISGFLITSVIVAQAETGRFSLIGFYAGRVRRLLPLTLLTLTTTVLIGVWLLPSTRAIELVGDARSALFYIANWRFADKSVAYFDTEVSEGLLTHYWSLAIEEQFYLGWPLAVAGAVLLVRHVPRLQLRTVVAAMTLAITIVSLAFSIRVTGTQGARAYYLTHLRLWEISTGALVAASIGIVRLGSRTRSALQLASIVAIVLAAAWYNDFTPFPGAAALLPVLATGSLIVFGGEHSSIDKVLGSGPMRYVGERSFALYLWHWPALGIAELLDRKFDVGWNYSAKVSAAVAASFVLAIVTHGLVENPTRFSLAFRRRPRSSIIAAVVCTLALLGGSALAHAHISASSAQVWGAARVTPEEAIADQANVDFRACQRNQTQGPLGEVAVWCDVGDPDGSRTILLVGDSHAQHWAPAFNGAGLVKGWRVLITTRSACLVYDIAIYNEHLELVDQSCRRWSKSVRQAIAAEPHVDLVVVGRAGFYSERVRAEDGSTISDQASEDKLSAAATEFLATTLNYSDRVMIIEDTPWSPHNVPDCLVATTPVHADDCDFEATMADAEIVLLRAEQEAVVAVSAERTSLASFDDLVCPRGLCRAVTPDGLITYRDNNHMTSTYSRVIGEDLDPFG